VYETNVCKSQRFDWKIYLNLYITFFVTWGRKLW